MKHIITVENLSKHFTLRTNKNLITGLFLPGNRTVKAVDSISFTVEKGEAVAFLGPNGAGKTTTTKMLTGLIYPTTGSVSVLGFSPFERKTDFLRRIGLVMGNKSGLNWDLTPTQSFYLLKEIYAIKPDVFEKRVKELAQLLEVEAHLDTQLRRLSLGERMKVELMGAILHDPEVLFLDEPTIGLDIITKKNIRLFLRDIQKKFHTTLILTSHDMDDIEQVCDRVIVINKGAKVYDDSIKSLTAEYQQWRYVRFIFDSLPDRAHFSEISEILHEEEGSFLCKVHAENMVKLVSRASSEGKLLDMQIESVPLEEIIAEVFRKSGSQTKLSNAPASLESVQKITMV